MDRNSNYWEDYISCVSVRMVYEKEAKYEGSQFSNSLDVAKIALQYCEGMDREVFCVLCVDSKHKFLNLHMVSMGILNQSMVHPREAFKIAILSGAAGMFLFHNHPSGDCEPSHEDIRLTGRLVEVGKLVGIPVIDHIIVGRDERYCSFAERELL